MLIGKLLRPCDKPQHEKKMKKQAKNTEIKVAVAEDLDVLFEQNETLSDAQAMVIVGGKNLNMGKNPNKVKNRGTCYVVINN